jgi:SAM-dependent methyltransferase
MVNQEKPVYTAHMFYPWTETVQTAGQHARSGQFNACLAVCRTITDTYGTIPDALLDVGALLSGFGFLAAARDCYERTLALAPADLRAKINLANLERDAGNHAEARRLYEELLLQQPDHPVLRRNLLTSLEYDPAVSDHERLAHARAWGQWAIGRAGGSVARPALRPPDTRPLKIGYLSADFCQHTVGLFVKDILKAHRPEQFSVYAYSAGQVHDWVTDTIRNAGTFHDVSTLDDTSLARLIRKDGIDILVDLSGHTAGSRLTVLAHRPAAVQVSWLGYFATNGLSYTDATLMDHWHLPQGSEGQFIEPVKLLETGRLCYQPVPWAPAEVAPPPCLQNGYVTFGCFNNTAKLNGLVFDVWGRILTLLPDARLILKWRTFNDDLLRQQVHAAFAERGISNERIELRGPSFHVDLLTEYADIDIALDPFPFTGGLTSCEALWMGVPVITWPQSRPVSRQTFAILSAIGLPELAAQDADDYLQIAVTLADDRARLHSLRAGMRDRMQASPLMQVERFTRQLEQTFTDLYQDISTRERERPMHVKTVLHVGPGHRRGGARLPVAFQSEEWREIRLDIDPANEPDIVGSMLNMAEVPDGSIDAVYSSHNIEHVYAHEVPVVLGEFLRVLKPEGFLVVTCPDLQTVGALIADDNLTDAAYNSQAGPITPLDILYGHGKALAEGHLYMAHKTGFTLKTLTAALHAAGFCTSAGKRRPSGFDLWMIATKGTLTEAALRELATRYLPA